MAYPQELATHFLGVGGLIIRDNQVLLVKLTYGGGRDWWLIPGGLVERGETLEEGLIREVKEETGLDVVPSGILGIRSMVRKEDTLTDVYTVFQCEVEDHNQLIKPQVSEIQDIQWFDLDELDEIPDLLSYTRTIIEKYLHSQPMMRDRSFDKLAKDRIKVTKYEQYWV